jgi:hypothetical protein
MTSDAYRDALNKAKAELIQAIKQRDHWNMEVARLGQLVESLSVSVDPKFAGMEEALAAGVGFTELVLGIINRSSKPLSPAQVKGTFVLFGYDVSGYSNPLALVHQTLKRLASQGKIREMADGTYKRSPLFEQLLNTTGDGRPRLGNPNPTNTQKAKPLVNLIRERKEWEKNEPK